MPAPEAVLRDSPVDFASAVAYALHPEMRRLIVLFVVGAVLLPVGLAMFVDPARFGLVGVVQSAVGLVVAVVGAAFLFGGQVGAAFKLVTDVYVLALEQ